MKKFLVQKTMEAQPMLRAEAEARLGHEVEQTTKDDMGFLVCDMEKLEWSWVPQKKFRGVPYDSTLDKLMLCLDQIKQWQEYFKTYTKEKENLTTSERTKIYQVKRHMKSLAEGVKAITNINLITVE